MGQHSALFAQDRQEALDRVLTERLGEYAWDLDLSRKQISFTGADRPIIARAGSATAEGRLASSSPELGRDRGLLERFRRLLRG